MQIQPIEELLFDGLLKRFAQVFQCKALITTTNDKTKTLSRYFEGQPVEYPYAFLTIQSVAHNKESYQSVTMSRRGLRVASGQNQAFMARVFPTNFTVEVEFHTNKFNGIEPQTVLGYARRWLAAYRCGFLKFNIQYGHLPVRIGITLDDTVPTPPLDNKVETESTYKIVTTMIVHGWTSEPTLGSQGVIEELDVESMFGAAAGYNFVPFN